MSSSSRIRELAASIPLCTKLLLGINIVIYGWMFLDSVGLQGYAISSYLICVKHEYYRMITSAFVHASMMHILMNMSTLLQLGVDLEVQFGSLNFALVTIWAVVISGSLYVALGWYDLNCFHFCHFPCLILIVI